MNELRRGIRVEGPKKVIYINEERNKIMKSEKKNPEIKKISIRSNI